MKHLLTHFKNKIFSQKKNMTPDDILTLLKDVIPSSCVPTHDSFKITDNHIKLILSPASGNDVTPEAIEKMQTIMTQYYPDKRFSVIVDIQVTGVKASHNHTEHNPPHKTPVFGGHGKGGIIDTTHITYILIIASGKGGVGKSTISLNLARAFAKAGYKTGLIDADIHGPSIPVMTGGYQEAQYEDGKLVPLIRDDVKIMSIGFMVHPAKAIVWRGPLISGAIQQMFKDVAWGALDIMVVDMPPGTGDAGLTICQNIKANGAIIVSTPQATSVIDAERCAAMFQKMNLPILGVIENMRGFIAPDTGKSYDIFGSGGAENFAKTYHYPFLGALPIVPEITQAGDEGQTFYATKGTEEVSRMLDNIVREIMSILQMRGKW